MEILEKLFSLKGKQIIVFGGGGQIGFELSKVCALSGANVCIADYDIEQVQKKIKSLDSKIITEKLDYFKVDVTSPDSVSNFYKKVYKKYNRINGIINSFHYKGDSRKLDAKASFFNDIENYPIDIWNKVHDVNLTGTFLTCKESIPYFKKNNGGVIINLSSTYGIVSPNKNIYKKKSINSPVAYASSKAGIINLTRYLATHLADYNIRVNVLSPGGVYNNQNKDFIKEYSKLTPLKRMANIEDYSGAIIYMLSNSSSYLTGSNIVVDGGWTAW